MFQKKERYDKFISFGFEQIFFGDASLFPNERYACAS